MSTEEQLLQENAELKIRLNILINLVMEMHRNMLTNIRESNLVVSSTKDFISSLSGGFPEGFDAEQYVEAIIASLKQADEEYVAEAEQDMEDPRGESELEYPGHPHPDLHDV